MMEIENEATGEDNAIGSSPRDCLLFKMESFNSEDGFTPGLVASNCFSKKPYLCEARVQTVTYYTW